MRLIALLILPSMLIAAPVPKHFSKPDVELTLSAKSQLVLEITIHNNGMEPLVVPYRFTHWEHIEVDLVGEKGEKYTIKNLPEDDEKETPGTLTIPAGAFKTLSIDTCHSLPELGEERQKVTFTARLKHGTTTAQSDPLTVKP